MSNYDYFMDEIWPHIIEKFGLEEHTEPTQEEYALWQGIEVDVDD